MVACADDSLSGKRSGIINPISNEGEEEDDPSTVPTTDEDEQDTPHAWPTAEGYTPLGVDMFSMGSVLVAMPPNDNNDDDENENGEGSNLGTYYSAGPNAFVADPSELFGNPTVWNDQNDADNNNDDDNVNDNNTGSNLEEETTGISETNNDDYRDAASSALLALENDYMMTMQGEVRTSLMYSQPSAMEEPSVPLFGSITLDPPASKEESGATTNFADFDSATATSCISMGEKKKQPPIDSAAVQKAVAGIISNTSDSLGAKLQKWQDDQDKDTRKRKEKREHDLIPSAPLKAFRKDTPKAILATQSLTRSATIADALQRMSELLQSQECLHIHIVGADHVECQSEDRIRHHFAPLVRWIGNNTYSPRNIKLSLVGPNVPTAMASISTVSSPTNLLATATTPPEQTQATHRLHTAIAVCYEASYHDWLAEQLKQNDAKQKSKLGLPDLVVCFNAGIWGYDEWKPTIRCLLDQPESAIPFLVTSYTIFEAEDDFDVIQEVVDSAKKSKNMSETNGSIAPKKKMQCIWGHEANRFGSKQKRETVTAVDGREYRENAAWQAWRL